jgi:hypothetical protein
MRAFCAANAGDWGDGDNPPVNARARLTPAR